MPESPSQTDPLSTSLEARSVETDTAAAAAASPRLSWLDGTKGIAILWIVFFHFFRDYSNGRFPIPWASNYFGLSLAQCDAHTALATITCLASATFIAIAMLGFHGVNVFIILSGFGLTYSVARASRPQRGWLGWYRSRLLRLFPMYWIAHLIYLVSPFEARIDPIDYRFVLSALGDRVYPVDIIQYLVPAWWYFGLILELYLIFPLLYLVLDTAGWRYFLAISGIITIVSRYVLLFILPMPGPVIAAFCGCRLWEFALGMVVGVWYRQDHDWVEKRMVAPGSLALGVALFFAGLVSYRSPIAYTVTDALIGTGLFVILAQMANAAKRVVPMATAIAFVGFYSYGLYLIHQPYVIYAGIRLRGYPMSEFVLAAGATIVVLVLGCAYIERWLNYLAVRVLGPR
jgi:peptidoglycan/LPS O-acetylase OafA/YrhL